MNYSKDQMRKDKELKGPADSERINLSEPHEVKYWATKLGVRHEDIEAAVNHVGDLAEDVKNYINRK